MKESNMMKKLLILLILIHFSCNKTLENETAVNEKQEVKIEQETINTISINSEENESIYIGVLKKMYGTNDYFISLSFKDSLPKSFYREFHGNTNKYTSKLISKTENHERFKIEDSIAKKLFSVKNLDTLIIFDNQQQILDTLHIKNYEYLSELTESQVVATYERSGVINKNKDYLCISKCNLQFKKNIEFEEDSKYLKETLSKNGFPISSIHSNYRLINNRNVISFASFGTYEKEDYKESFYLFKNGKATDSIINDYSIYKMISVPISLESESLYVSYEHIPDTDIFWTSLKGIDVENNKLKNYPNNRITLKK